MHKLEWMDKLKVGDVVVYMHSAAWSSGEGAETPITVTAVGKKSVFAGDKRFSKWNGFQVKSDGRPVSSLFHFGKNLQIRPMNDNDKGRFDNERERLTSDLINAPYNDFPLQDIRWLQSQVQRLSSRRVSSEGK